MSNATTALIELRHHYEGIIAQAEYQSAQAKAQLEHIDALLVNGLLQAQDSPALNLTIASPVQSAIAAAEPIRQPTPPQAPAANPTNTKIETSDAPSAPTVSDQGKRDPRPLLPAYQGLTRLEAIAQILQTTPGQEVTTDDISRALFGELSSAEHQAERKSLSTQLYKGVSLKRWQKGTTRSSFIIGEPTLTAPAPSIAPESAAPPAPATPAAPATKERTSLPLLSAFEGITKREAIAQVLQQYSGEVLHQDTIIQTLYGDLSLEDLKGERKRMSTVLLNGVRDKRWKKAAAPSSYFLSDTAANSKPKRPSRKPDPSKEPQPEPVAEAVEEITPAPTEAPAAKTKAARKPGRKPAIAKANPKRKRTRSKQSELELVALLRKADVQI